MKLSDKELRECAKGGHWCKPENRPAMASELLQRRREVRRLRAVLRFLHERSREGDWYAVSQELTRQAALKPQRGGK